MTENKRRALIKKLQSKTEFLTRKEAGELGPLASRDLAPITGDSFMDSMVLRERASKSLLRATQKKIRAALKLAESKRQKVRT